MHDSDLPTATDADEHTESEAPAADAELDAIADDLDTVEAAMQALDADDFDHAETLAASLDTAAAGADTDTGGSGRTEAAPDPETPEV